jgi:hypothetical protein
MLWHGYDTAIRHCDISSSFHTLCNLDAVEGIAEFIVKGCQVCIQFLRRNLGVNLGCGDVRVAENAAHALYRHPVRQSHCRESVPCAVPGDRLLDAAFLDNRLELSLFSVNIADLVGGQSLDVNKSLEDNIKR